MHCFIFDVDGVLTQIESKKSNPLVLARVAMVLEQGNAVAFNTGRSFTWLIERVLQPLQDYAKIETYAGHLLGVCEMGNTVVTFEHGTWKEAVDPSALIPEPLQNEIKTLVEKEYADSMFFDDKKTMVSVEVRDGYDTEEYLRQQKKLLDQIHEILQKPEYKNLHLKTGSNRIALDVQNENSGKKLGAKKIIEWIKNKGFEITSVITFGDNTSDLEMAEALVKEYKTEFVFVGEDAREIDSDKYPFPILRTHELYDAGTLEYFKNPE